VSESGVSELPRGTVTLLFSDVQGSTRLVRALGARYDEALAAHRRLLREAFAAHAGVEVDTQGDSFLVAFARARDAIDAAADAQRALASQAWPGGEPLSARIGIHTGEPELSGGGYYVGIDLTRGARIAAAAHGGQVLFSQATREVVGEDVNARDLGDYELKGLAAPERVFQLVAPGLTLEFPPLRAQRRGNLPSPRTPLVGRESEVAHLLALLGAHALVTLTGPGGVGKTRLALEVARAAAGSFADGAFFVPLAAVGDPDSTTAVIAHALDISEEPGESPFDALRRTLRDHELLLVLDSFERLVTSAPLVAQLVESCPRLKVLATSRERLHLAVESEYQLPPLAADDAVSLFEARAGVAPGERERVLAICLRLDRLPLAIELAAARVRLLPLSAIQERLEQRLPFLTGGPRDLPARQQTLAATIDWSYALLDADEQAMLNRLGVFAGGFSLAAAVAMDGDDEQTLRLLSSLRDKSLIVPRAASDGGARFGMLDTIREYALARLRESGDADDALRTHAQHFAAFAEAADHELRGPAQATWLGRLADDHANLRAALVWARDAGADDVLIRIAGALWRFWFIRGHVRVGRGWLDEALARRSEQPDAVLGRTLFGASTLALADDDVEAARAFGEQRLAIARMLGDDRDVASALSALANVNTALGDYTAASELYEEAVEHASRGEAWPELAATMNNLGYLALMRDDTARAIADSGAARARFGELGFREDYAGAGVNVALGLLREGRPEEALPIVAESLALYTELGHDDGVSYALDAAAAAALHSGADPRRCALLSGAAVALRRRTGTLLPPVERRLHEETLSELATRLGEPELRAALAEGEELQLDDALAVADGALLEGQAH
jgi:predicted ATPase/class 3 adenylate cyclase